MCLSRQVHSTPPSWEGTPNNYKGWANQVWSPHEVWVGTSLQRNVHVLFFFGPVIWVPWDLNGPHLRTRRAPRDASSVWNSPRAVGRNRVLPL